MARPVSGRSETMVAKTFSVTFARRIGRVAHHPRVEKIKRRVRALRGEIAQRVGIESFAAPRIANERGKDAPYLWNAEQIDAVGAATDPRRETARAHVEQLADTAMAGPAYSVMDKSWLPPGNDRHDYYTGGSYWWPVEKAPAGTPWVFRDGHMNPVRYGEEYDLTRLDRFAEAVKMLSLAYRFTARREYADRAAALIRTWFLDPETRINPHLAYAQIVPGAKKLTGTGIIETLRLVGVIDAIGLIADSGALSTAELDGVRDWVARFAHWLRTSPNGIMERATNNNHGLSYDIQLMTYSLFTGDVTTAKAVAEAMPKMRIFRQIREDGSLPEEMRRKEAFFYVAYGLGFFFDAATLAERVGVDLWRYRSRYGTGIEPAFRSLMRYADARARWPHGGERVPDPELYALALRGAWAYGDAALGEIADGYAARLALQPVDWTIPRYAAFASRDSAHRRFSSRMMHDRGRSPHRRR